jgi:hypothetical protein
MMMMRMRMMMMMMMMMLMIRRTIFFVFVFIEPQSPDIREATAGSREITLVLNVTGRLGNLPLDEVVAEYRLDNSNSEWTSTLINVTLTSCILFHF